MKKWHMLFLWFPYCSVAVFMRAREVAKLVSDVPTYK